MSFLGEPNKASNKASNKAPRIPLIFQKSLSDIALPKSSLANQPIPSWLSCLLNSNDLTTFLAIFDTVRPFLISLADRESIQRPYPVSALTGLREDRSPKPKGPSKPSTGERLAYLPALARLIRK
jgi:hypothetical protein